MSLKYWILVGQTPIEVDRDEWGSWFEHGDRIVELTEVRARGKDYRVSTVFLGVDHGFGMAGDLPILFETMVFVDYGDDPWADYQIRSRSYLEAKRTHQMVEIQVGANDKP